MTVKMFFERIDLKSHWCSKIWKNYMAEKLRSDFIWRTRYRSKSLNVDQNLFQACTKVNFTSQFLICPPEVAFDRDQNQKCKIHFWATWCIGNIKMAITSFIYRKSLIFLANKNRSFDDTFKTSNLWQLGCFVKTDITYVV